MSSTEKEPPLAEEDQQAAVDEAGKPLSAEELKLKELKKLKKKRYMENKKRKEERLRKNPPPRPLHRKRVDQALP